MVTINLENVDWALLRRQKEWLANVAMVKAPQSQGVVEFSEGLLALLDKIQDQAALKLGNQIVFGEEFEF